MTLIKAWTLAAESKTTPKNEKVKSYYISYLESII